MKFTSAITALAAVLAVDAATLEQRQSSQCAGAAKSMAAYDRPFVYPLFTACKNALGDSVAAKENPWVNKHCVAAAIAASIPTFHDGLTCGVSSQNSVVLTEISTWPSLDYNVYASIVGDCAWAEGGCPITKQNFIDLVYGAISETTQGPYPKSSEVLIDYYIKPIFDWTAFDMSTGVPYVNFNDWLHWSPNVNHCTSTFQCD
ncbi:hypothetical protein PENSPDRAFT_680940 [Peniophora sp. CONT]|nr:hypothetical protein PENSPDRAFT_680940 [Peniophora sp. CONT]